VHAIYSNKKTIGFLVVLVTWIPPMLRMPYIILTVYGCSLPERLAVWSLVRWEPLNHRN
jgi:hypothetical protein